MPTIAAIRPTSQTSNSAITDSRLSPVAVSQSVLRGWPSASASAAPPRPAQLAAVQRAQASAPPVPARELAALSADVYNDRAKPPTGWREATQAELAALRIDRSMLTHPSGFRARIYVDTRPGNDGRMVVAFRGTVTREDWITDAKQAAGQPTVSYDMANELATSFLRVNAAVTMTGHSLGGGLASAAAVATGRPATTFNAAGLSDRTLDVAAATRATLGARAPSVDAYYVRGEILSALQDGGDRIAGAILGRMAGSAVAGPWGGLVGSYAGSRIDAPEAYGRRIALDPVRANDAKWYIPDMIERHGMAWVLASMNTR